MAADDDDDVDSDGDNNGEPPIGVSDDVLLSPDADAEALEAWARASCASSNVTKGTSAF